MYKNFFGESPSIVHGRMNPIEFAQMSNATAYARMNTKLTQHMEDVYRHNFEKLGETLPPAPPVQKEVIDRLIHEDWIGDGDNFSDRIWKNKALMAKKAKDFITLAIAEGKSPTAFIEDLEPYLQKQGL